jgi:hypothetical protein
MSLQSLFTHGRGPWTVALVVGALILAGCGSGGYSGPTGTVSGTVTLNGDPVPQGSTVVFLSDAGHTASGQIGAGGSYSLSVVGKSGKCSAVPVASYKVFVTPPAKGGGVMSEDSEEYAAMMESSASGEEQPAGESAAEEEVIPAKFQSAATSDLVFEVKKGPNTIDVTLE